MRRDVAPQISENLGRHPTKALKRLASPLAAARRTVQLTWGIPSSSFICPWAVPSSLWSKARARF